MFKPIIAIIFLVFPAVLLSQNDSFTSQETKSIEKQRTGTNVWIENDLVKNEIEFRSAVITKLPVLATDYGIALKFRCYVAKTNNSICLKAIEFKQKVSKTGMVVKYDKVILLVGDNKDFRNGESIKYEFNVNSDRDGIAYINDIRIYDAFKYAIDNYKSIEIHFYNSIKDLARLLVSIQEKEMFQQRQILESQFDEWKGTFEQIDDVCIVGLRIV